MDHNLWYIIHFFGITYYVTIYASDIAFTHFLMQKNIYIGFNTLIKKPSRPLAVVFTCLQPPVTSVITLC